MSTVFAMEFCDKKYRRSICQPIKTFHINDRLKLKKKATDVEKGNSNPGLKLHFHVIYYFCWHYIRNRFNMSRFLCMLIISATSSTPTTFILSRTRFIPKRNQCVSLNFNLSYLYCFEDIPDWSWLIKLMMMKANAIKWSWFMNLIIFFLHCSNGIAVKSERVPALFVFGDSLVDVGNNNYLSSIAKANYFPYGIDFAKFGPTGRFSNGKTFVDILGKLLWRSHSALDSPREYLSPVH